ncbi:MAG: hypothetical protein ABI666_03245 [Ferruginibacter sp.]
MARLSIILCLFLAASCGSDSKEITSNYTNYQFDKQVIEKLPVYDSLVQAILENYSSVKKHINEDESYRAYRYFPLSDSTDLFKILPREGAVKINQYFTQLGKNFIYGFDVFKDSTVKIYIRKSSSEKEQVDIGENLSYYPPGINIRRREFPFKDTILNKNWQYWIGFDKRDLF